MDAKMRADFVNSVASGQKVPCPVCNTLNDPDGSFCIACGHSLKKEEKFWYGNLPGLPECE